MTPHMARLRGGARAAGVIAAHAAILALQWLLVSVQVAACLALAALAFDAVGRGPLLAEDPAVRLRWVAGLGAVAGLARVIERQATRPPA